MLVICINITTLSFSQVQYESPKQLSSLKIRSFKPSRGVVSILFRLMPSVAQLEVAIQLDCQIEEYFKKHFVLWLLIALSNKSFV